MSMKVKVVSCHSNSQMYNPNIIHWNEIFVMQDEMYKNRLVCYIASDEIFDICKFTIKYII